MSHILKPIILRDCLRNFFAQENIHVTSGIPGGLPDAGDPVGMAKFFSTALTRTNTWEKRGQEHVRSLVEELFRPYTTKPKDGGYVEPEELGGAENLYTGFPKCQGFNKGNNIGKT